jgi:flagellar hook-length control protein FliK
VSTVPTDPVQPGAALARATSPQAGAASSGETSPFEVLLDTGQAPVSPASSKQAPPSRAAAGQSTMPAAAASQLRTPLAAPATQSAAAPTHGSNDAAERTGLVGDFNQQGRVTDATGPTAPVPMPTLTDPAGARTTGEPMAAGPGSASPDDPQPATVARKSDKASAKSGDASTAALPAPASGGAVMPQQPASATTPTPAVTALAPVLPGTPAAPVRAAPQPAAVASATAAAAPATAPSSGAALGGPTAAATLLAGDLSSLPLEPTVSGSQAAALASAAVEPTSAESSGEKPANSPAAADEVAGAKPMVAGVKPTQASASAPTPTAGSGSAGAPVQGASGQFQSASAAASVANGANHADVTLASGVHVDPPGAAPANADAGAPSGTALTQSATPPVSANSLLPSTPAASTGEPTPPSSPTAVPISGLAVEIAARVTRDEKSFQIRLDPPELGRIDVQLSMDASGHVTTHLTADRPETLNLLRQDASSLQRALESTGLKSGSGGLEFSLRNQSFGGAGGGQHGGQSNGTASPVARIIVSDEDMPAGQTAPRGYARLSGVGTGVDIRV